MGTVNEAYNHYWYPVKGAPVRITAMEDSHILHILVKFIRDKGPNKIGMNDMHYMLPILRSEIKRRGIEHKLIEYEIRDAKKCEDTRRLVLAIAEKEKINGRTTDTQAKGDIP